MVDTLDLKEALRAVIDELDREMEESPSQELANVSNFLEARYREKYKEA